MANRSNEAAGAAALNGLVGGFLQGHDLRRQRTQDQQDQVDRTRRMSLEDETLLNSREDRVRNNAIRDYEFTQSSGLDFEATTPSGIRAQRLRMGVAERLDEIDQVGVPDGMVRVGLSEQDEMYRVLGRRLAMDPALVEAAHRNDVLDEIMSEGSSGATYGATGGGDPTMSGGTIQEQRDFLEANPRSTRGPNSTASYGVGADGEMTMTGGTLAEATRFEESRRPDDEGISLGGPDITDLPISVQASVTQLEPALASLDHYEELATAYLTRSRGDRAAGRAGWPNAERDREVGQIQAAQNALLLSVKELAGLGVINGPDLEIVTNLIGDPLSKDAVIRDPSFVLGRIDEARRFLESKAESLDANYGTTLIEDQEPQPLGGRLGDLSRGAHPTPVGPSGMSDVELLARIRGAG